MTINFAKKYSLSSRDRYLKAQLGQVDLIGRGIAGVESVYTIPQWGITFDTGRAPSFAVHHDVLAISHFHPDHAGSLSFYLGLRCLNSLKPLKIVVPVEKEKAVNDYLSALKILNDTNITYEVVPANQEVLIKKHLSLCPVESFHCTDSTGYLVKERKQKLSPLFKNKTKNEIIKAKAKGIQVHEDVEEILFAYSGDSRAEFFTTEAKKAKILLMECSFFSKDFDPEALRHYGHTHISDWVKYADQIENEIVIMTHTSQRYSKIEIEDYCKRLLPERIVQKLLIFR